MGEVLGEAAVEHSEAACVHLADGALCLVPCPGGDRQVTQGAAGEGPASATLLPYLTLSSASHILGLQGTSCILHLSIVIIALRSLLSDKLAPGAREGRGPQTGDVPRAPRQKLMQWSVQDMDDLKARKPHGRRSSSWVTISIHPSTCHVVWLAPTTGRTLENHDRGVSP